MLSEFSYTIKGNNTIRIDDYIGTNIYDAVNEKGDVLSKECLFVPKVILGCPVTEIGDKAFSPDYEYCDKSKPYREKVRHIYLPDTIEEIGDCAFAGCSCLEAIYIPSKRIKRIGSFDWSSQFSTIDLSTNPFQGCPNLTVYYDNDCASLPVFCSSVNVRHAPIAERGEFQDSDYKSNCQTKYLEFAFRNKYANLNIGDDSVELQVSLGERALKVFREKASVKELPVIVNAWAFTHVIWFSIKIGEFDAIFAPYSPYVNSHPTYTSKGKNAFDQLLVTIP